MANDEIIIKVGTDVDKAQVQDLEDILNQISQTSVNIKPEVDTSQIQQLESEIEELEAKAVLQEMFGDTTGLEQTQQEIEALQLKIEELKGTAQSIDSTGFDGLSQGADTATESVENLETSLDGLSMLAVGDVLQQYGDQAEQMAQSMNEANITVGQLAIQTGVAEPQLRSMIAGISNATFPTSEAMMYVKSLDQMGVSANNLGNSATGLDMINDAFGLGADKVNSLGQELGVLGVDMNNVSSSFNALAYANANTVGGMDNYYSFLRRYDAQFKELGLNVDQASVLIAGATQKFGGGRSAVSGLNSVLKESNGDLSVMEQKLGLTAGSLSNATQLTGQYTGQLEQMAEQEAEHKTILDQVGSAWDRLSMVIGGVLSPISSLIGAGGQLIGVGTQLNGTLELFGKFQGMGNPFSSLSTHLSSLKTNIIGVASSITTNLTSAFTSLSSTLTGTVIPAVAQGATRFLELGRNALTAGANALASAAGWIAQKVALVASTIASYAQAAATRIVAAAQGFLNMVMMMNPIMLLVIAIVALVAILIILYQNVDSVRQVIDQLWQGALQAWNSITSTFMGIYNSIKQALSNAINSVTSFISNLVSGLTNGAMNAVNGFIDWIKQMKDKLVEELGHMLDEAKKFAMDIANALTLGGAGMVAGWISGSGESSPGYMYDHFIGELKAMEDAPGKYDIAGGMTDVGSSMVQSFNPNIGSSSAGVIGTNNITINIESVDNEDRIQEIVNAVEQALKFDNLTAGRTV